MTDLSERAASREQPEPALSEQGEVIGRLAHELKTPLTVAKGFAYTLRTSVERLFTKYERLGSSVKGTGLGLYISRGIARAHGGDITVVSDGKSGCTFTLRFPMQPTGDRS